MQNLKNISKKLSKIWKKVYIVWWWCREKYLNWKYIWDIDLATDATPEQISMVLNVIKEVGKKYWTLIILEWNETFEITTFRSDIWILNNRKPVEVKFCTELNLDSKRRDFSFNSIYFDIENEIFIDPENWIKDIDDKIIRFAWDVEKRIEEDALRILRFIRFKHKYWFKDAQDNYFDIVKSKIYLLNNISIERIKDEFDKILLLENNTKALEELINLWFFKEILPEVHNLKNTPWWPSHHLEWNVWIHTLMTLNELNKIFSNDFLLPDNKWNIWKITFSQQDKLDLTRTLLLHDIWKFETYSIDEYKNVHYYDHENIWYEKFLKLSSRLKFSNNSKDKIKYLIKNHLRVFKVFLMKDLKAKKFMLDKYFKELIIILIAYNLWRKPANLDAWDKILNFYADFLKYYSKLKFYNWTEILKMYPDLKWSEIKNILELKNNEILLWRKNKQSF